MYRRSGVGQARQKSSVGTLACDSFNPGDTGSFRSQEWLRYRELQEVVAGEDGDGFAGGEFAAVGGNVEETVALGYGGEIAGALPPYWRNGWFAGGPAEQSRQKMREAGFFVKRLAEARIDERQRGRRSAAEHFDR